MTQAAILAASGSPGTTQGFKNRVINGDMRIDQRNAGASLTLNGTSNQYGIDRFYFNSSQASKLTAQQSTTVPAGFYNSYAITVASAASIGSGDYFTMNQVIEANNTTDLNFGTASAKTVTLSFWVRSSVTGTFVVALLNAALSRSYLATYTISAANTWQQISIPIAGDTSGTWVQGGNTGGVQVRFDFGSGSSGMGTANAWQAGNLWSVSGSASSTFAAQSGATFYITGLQLEVGNTATNFDFRSYGTELQLCQRYFEKGGMSRRSGGRTAGSYETTPIFYKATKRTSPTLTLSSGYTLDGWATYQVGSHDTPTGSNDPTCWGNLEAIAGGSTVPTYGVIACLWTASAEL